MCANNNNAEGATFHKALRLFKEAIDSIMTLYIFDFDMTLAMSLAKIRNKATGEIVSHEEFDAANKRSDFNQDDYDYSEFRTNLEFKPIGPTLELFQKLLEQKKNVIVLTARSSEVEPLAFLSSFVDESHNLNDVDVVAINKPGSKYGSLRTDPEKKSAWLADKLSESPYRQVVIYEDSGSNIQAFQELREKFPQIVFNIQRVKFNPSTDQTSISPMEEDFQRNVKKNHAKKKRWLIGQGNNKTKTSFRFKPSYERSKSAPPGAGGS